MGITLLRCDDRLIHGQCIVKVLNDCSIEHIILVDAFTASSPVLKNIYKMAVPPNVEIDVLLPDEAIKKIEEYALKQDKTLVLVKDPIVALQLQKNTEALPKSLNIGPMSNRQDSIKATYYSYLLQKEIDACEELSMLGIQVFFRQVPGEKELSWMDAKKLF